MQLTTDQFLSLLRQVIQEEMVALKLLRQEDRLLTAKEAAEILKVSPRYLYKHADKLRYAVKLSPSVVRFSHQEIQKEIQNRVKDQARNRRNFPLDKAS